MPGDSEISGASGQAGTGGIGHRSGSGGDFEALAPGLTRRIGSILETVEREADRMLEDARVEAQRQVGYGKRQAAGPLAERQRRLVELSDQLIARTEAVVAQLGEAELVRDSFGRLLRALSETADRLAAEARAGSVSVGAAPAAAPVQAPVEARQAAIQMAAAGSTRAEVEAHLRGYLQLADPTALLDQLYGAAASGDARVAWAIVPTAPSGSPTAAEDAPRRGSIAGAAHGLWRRRRRR